MSGDRYDILIRGGTVVDAAPCGPGSDRQATIVFLWISSPQHRSWITSIAHSSRY